MIYLIHLRRLPDASSSISRFQSLTLRSGCPYNEVQGPCDELRDCRKSHFKARDHLAYFIFKRV